MPLNEDQSRNRGFCHIEFENAESVDKAMLKVGMNIDGRNIRMDYSTSKKKTFGGRGGFGGGNRRGGFGGGRGGGYGGNRRGGFGGRGGRGGSVALSENDKAAKKG